MRWTWIKESPPAWDETKRALFERLPTGIFALGAPKPGAILPGEWWRVEDPLSRRTIGYAWMDATWGEAEVLLAVDPDRRRQGIGAFILDQLSHEARAKGQRYLVNLVRDTHPARHEVTRWLLAHGFEVASDGRLVRKTS